MNILHLYDEDDHMAARYVALLVQASDGRAAMRSATSADGFRKCLVAQSADIVHVHGQPKVTLPSNCRCVLTPHGHQLQLSSLRPQPFVVIARSRMEQQALACPRCEVVPNPIITRTTTPDACARQMQAIYQRVLQSDVLPLMSNTTRQALTLLLAAAISADRRWLGHSGSGADDVLSQADFQQLYIYAHHEGVLPLLRMGLDVLGYDKAPAMEPFASYLPDGYVQPAPMPGADVTALLVDVKANGPSLLRLCELAQALRSDRLDEDRLLSTLTQQHLVAFMSATLQLLAEQTLLTEGFMPCPPADNALTSQLRMQLQHRQHIC